MSKKVAQKTELQDITLEEFIFSKEELARMPFRAENSDMDHHFFVMDAKVGKFENYEGTFVLYYHGNLCGQSVDGEYLYKTAIKKVYSDISIFEVPEDLTKIIGLTEWTADKINSDHKRNF